MNLRQKAKHFRRLYEEALPKRPYPVVIKTELPYHYKIKKSIAKENYTFYVSEMFDHLRDHIISDMTRQLKPIVSDHVKTQENRDMNTIEYSMDIWVD